MFYVHPYLGKIPILTHIFQMGGSTTNHQLRLVRKVSVRIFEGFFSLLNQIQGGPLLVISRAITPINGLING